MLVCLQILSSSLLQRFQEILLAGEQLGEGWCNNGICKCLSACLPRLPTFSQYRGRNHYNSPGWQTSNGLLFHNWQQIVFGNKHCCPYYRAAVMMYHTVTSTGKNADQYFSSINYFLMNEPPPAPRQLRLTLVISVSRPWPRPERGEGGILRR